MWYEINVSKDGQHYFATHKRSISSIKKAREIRDKLMIAMPEKEGYRYDITKWSTVGETIRD